ncbi:MAG: glycosyltransferase, partial [Lewinella sp.]|nr:glycosyltransferase [Lewinella sp.]
AEVGVLAKVAAAFTADPSLQAVYGDLDYVAANDLNHTVRRWRAGASSPRRWRQGWMPPHPTFFARREVYAQYGNFNPQLRFAADYELMLRCCYCHGIKTAYLPGVMVKMRVGGASNSSLKNRLRANREDQLAWQLNGLPSPFGLAFLKPLRKISQWW